MKFSADKFTASMCKESYFEFFKEFWSEFAEEKLVLNWHIQYLCDELQAVAERVFKGQQKEYDIICNCPPGTSKSSIFSVLFQPWVWARMPSARVITGSFSERLALDLSRKSRGIIMSEKYKRFFPYIELSEDQNTKGYFVNTKGGMRYAVGVGGSVIGMHAHFIIPDDPIDPQGVLSEAVMEEANTWIRETLSQRKVNKAVTPTMMVMQRLHQNDPTGDWVERGGNIKHFILPAEDDHPINPPELKERYQDGLLDPVRLSKSVLEEAFKTLLDVGYAGQFSQQPVPRSGALFKIDRFQFNPIIPKEWKVPPIRYWDKAISLDKRAAFTVGVKGGVDKSDNLWILDVKRGRWDAGSRELLLLQTAGADGRLIVIWMEQEPASSGKESVDTSMFKLATHGYAAKADRVTGSKEIRADTLSVAVNMGKVILVPAEWNKAFVEEFRYFPNSRYKDQVDATSGLFGCVHKPRIQVGVW